MATRRSAGSSRAAKRQYQPWTLKISSCQCARTRQVSSVLRGHEHDVYCQGSGAATQGTCPNLGIEAVRGRIGGAMEGRARDSVRRREGATQRSTCRCWQVKDDIEIIPETIQLSVTVHCNDQVGFPWTEKVVQSGNCASLLS